MPSFAVPCAVEFLCLCLTKLSGYFFLTSRVFIWCVGREDIGDLVHLLWKAITSLVYV